MSYRDVYCDYIETLTGMIEGLLYGFHWGYGRFWLLGLKGAFICRSLSGS